MHTDDIVPFMLRSHATAAGESWRVQEITISKIDALNQVTPRHSVKPWRAST
jgi:hypothetical protein